MKDTSVPRDSSVQNPKAVHETLKRKRGRPVKIKAVEGGEKRPFACRYPDCHKAFARMYNLSTHEQTHNPNRKRKYVCSNCPNAFDRNHDLRRHEASVHRAERNFSCSRCGKYFSRKDALHRHIRVGNSCLTQADASPKLNGGSDLKA